MQSEKYTGSLELNLYLSHSPATTIFYLFIYLKLRLHPHAKITRITYIIQSGMIN